MQKVFSTPEPVELYVETGSGDVKVTAASVTESTVNVEGPDDIVDRTTVEQQGSQLVVIVPKQRSGFFGMATSVDITVTVPEHSDLVTKCGSADLFARGRFGTVSTRSGSGDVRVELIDGDAQVESGSGDVGLGQVNGNLHIKSGSGDVLVETAAGSTGITTGSGDITVSASEADLSIKSGSGDVEVRNASSSVMASTASGDLHIGSVSRGSIRAQAVSGDVSVGVEPGIPVWTDVKTVSGQVSSNLEGAGEPSEGADFIELRASTVSGDVQLVQL